MLLHIIVSVGFVVGVIAPITPKGLSSTKVSPSSPDIASVLKSSTPGVFSKTSLFFINLYSYSPIPVSSAAIFDIMCKFSSFPISHLMAFTNLSLSDMDDCKYFL
ncbi:hypothetical protein SDC9_167848 [bioreactor metagenome]|uniref:Uncharacterized protein n=1 Tax=bioreactor metagenome TaxID=1076179 RepID=A0A645G3S8_9ZZZZ